MWTFYTFIRNIYFSSFPSILLNIFPFQLSGYFYEIVNLVNLRSFSRPIASWICFKKLRKWRDQHLLFLLYFSLLFLDPASWFSGSEEGSWSQRLSYVTGYLFLPLVSAGLGLALLCSTSICLCYTGNRGPKAVHLVLLE